MLLTESPLSSSYIADNDDRTDCVRFCYRYGVKGSDIYPNPRKKKKTEFCVLEKDDVIPTLAIKSYRYVINCDFTRF